eukprot:444029_1
MTAIQLRSTKNEILNFESRNSCQSYLKSLGINISHGTITKVCQNRSQLFGYTFLYLEEAKYENKVIDLEGEIWKFYASTYRGTKYWISNKARIKSLKTNGREQLLKSSLNAGYMKAGRHLRQLRGGSSAYLHKLVATCWVPNPNKYTMVDHIDTDIHNNLPSNLRWVANHAENQANETSRINMSIDIKVQQISLVDGTVIKVWDRAVCVQRKLGFKSACILNACRG